MRADQLLELAMTEERFWHHQLQGLSFGTLDARADALGPLEVPIADSRARLDRHGWFRDRCAPLANVAQRIAAAVAHLHAQGFPGIFVFLADEPWACFQALDPMLRAFLGDGYRWMPNFWVWHVDPKEGGAGWRPHRDRGRDSLAEDGAPLSLTAWMPLTHATRDNGCMYVVPKDADPKYAQEDEFDFPRERGEGLALPAKPGEYLCWNQAILHWGGESQPTATEPRMSMAFEFQRGDCAPFNQPLLVPFAPLDFDTRLRLVAQQITQYAHFEGLSESLVRSAERISGTSAALA